MKQQKREQKKRNLGLNSTKKLFLGHFLGLNSTNKNGGQKIWVSIQVFVFIEKNDDAQNHVGHSVNADELDRQ